MTTIEIELSAIGPSISDQLKAQGRVSVGVSVELLDRLANAITLAFLHGCLTDSECHKARKRLVRMIKIRPKD